MAEIISQTVAAVVATRGFIAPVNDGKRKNDLPTTPEETDRRESLIATLNSILSGTKLPERIFVVDSLNPSTAAAAENVQTVDAASQLIQANNLKTQIVHIRTEAAGMKCKSFADSVKIATASQEFPASTGYLWLLHSDTIASPNSLESMLSEAKNSETIAVVGAKQVDQETKVLLNVGFTQVKAGRRVTRVGYQEVDQNQYDAREDVLAVSLNGALVEAELYRTIGGINPSFSLNDDSLDFCRRVHLAGRRVVVSSYSTQEHSQVTRDSLTLKQRLYAKTRSLTLYRLSICCLPSLLPMWLFLLFGSFFNAIRQLYSDENGSVAILRGQLSAVFSFGAVAKARALNSKARAAAKNAGVKTNRRLLKPLYAKRHDERIINHDKKMELASKLWEPFTPGLLQVKELKYLATKRRLALFLTTALLIILSCLRLTNAVYGLFEGGHFANYPTSVANLGEIFNAATSNWVNQDFGYNSAPDGFLFPLMLLTILCLGSVQTAITVFVCLATLLAGLSMWVSSGAFTRNNTIRMLSALLWPTLPLFSEALLGGEIQNVFSFILMPLLPFAFTRALGLQRTDLELGAPGFRCYYALLGLVGAFVCGATPSMFIPVVVILVFMGLKNQRFWFSLVAVIGLNALMALFLVIHLPQLSFKIFFLDIKPWYSLVFLAVFILIQRLTNQRVFFERSHLAQYGVALGLVVAIILTQLFTPIFTTGFDINKSKLEVTKDYSVPAVAAKLHANNNGAHILAIAAENDGEFSYSVISGRSSDIVNTSTTAGIIKGAGVISEKDMKLRETIAKLMGAPDDSVITSLQDLGIGGIFFYREGILTVTAEKLISQIDSISGITRVVEGNEQAFWRVGTGQAAWDDTPHFWALVSPLRILNTALMLVVFLAFALLSLPIGTRRIIRYEI